MPCITHSNNEQTLRLGATSLSCSYPTEAGDVAAVTNL